MARSSKRNLSVTFGLAFFALLLTLAGCNKSEDSAGSGSTSTTTAAAGGGASSAALTTFKANCSNCHSVGGEGRGKDLSHIGGEHDQSWIADYIKHPMAQRMPSFDGKIPDADIQALASYLASQK